MRTKKVFFELPDYFVTMIFFPKDEVKALNDNKPDEDDDDLQDMLDKYDK